MTAGRTVVQTGHERVSPLSARKYRAFSISRGPGAYLSCNLKGPSKNAVFAGRWRCGSMRARGSRKSVPCWRTHVVRPTRSGLKSDMPKAIAYNLEADLHKASSVCRFLILRIARRRMATFRRFPRRRSCAWPCSMQGHDLPSPHF